ncbi:hypothetical protein [Symmachiella dynata]|uniref:hypothetical protein n=1 Tax=Symmachiella dynata TaxID=2527995 RepID=UPI00119D55A5|nr:hypothetical protein [Symmachiella dynata]
MTRVFYYSTSPQLLIEIIDRRKRDLKHLVRLVDRDGNPVLVPEGCRFEHIQSDECDNLLEHYAKDQERIG